MSCSRGLWRAALDSSRGCAPEPMANGRRTGARVRRPTQHVMEDRAENLIHRLFPDDLFRRKVPPRHRSTWRPEPCIRTIRRCPALGCRSRTSSPRPTWRALSRQAAAPASATRVSCSRRPCSRRLTPRSWSRAGRPWSTSSAGGPDGLGRANRHSAHRQRAKKSLAL
jgi:hypothetical protein